MNLLLNLQFLLWNCVTVIPSHEELKESVVQCLKYLFLYASIDVIESFYTRENAAKLSQSIYTCLSIAKTEKSSSLR